MPYRMISVLGAAAMLSFALALSSKRKSIRMRTVAIGVGTQWVVGFLLLQSEWGRAVLDAAASGVTTVLEQSYEGSAFVFGALGMKGGGESSLGVLFAFQVLPTIVFIASLFAVLYHLGVMQLVVRGLAWLMVRTMGTSGAESLSIAASVFMGQTEAPLTIRPFLAELTESELFTVMVGGLASVSGAILGAYVVIGKVPMAYLLTAVAMTAPASLVMAKIVVPETEEPKTAGAVRAEAPSEDVNLLDAAASGASEGLKLALNVGAMLIAFIALIALVDALLSISSVGGEALTLRRMLGWLFTPFALLMGTPWEEAQSVGSVLGTRSVVNELVAFEHLREIAGNLSPRAHAIATFAICGFANISSIGILIGGLGGLVPERKHDIARLGLKALAAATLANFSSACVVGALS